MSETSERHILVVDDDILTACALKEHLERQGYSVTLAEKCSEAQVTLRSPKKVNLMILDHLMPGGHGTELLSAMAAETALQKPDVIMSSCVADPLNPAWESLRKRLPPIAQGLIKAYVNKPYSLSMMDAMVNLLLAAPAPAALPTTSNEFSSGDYLLDAPLYPYAPNNIKSPL